MPTTKAGERLLDWGEYDRLLMGREMTALRNRIRAVERQSVAAERARIRAAVEGLRTDDDEKPVWLWRAAVLAILDADV